MTLVLTSDFLGLESCSIKRGFVNGAMCMRQVFIGETSSETRVCFRLLSCRCCCVARPLWSFDRGRVVVGFTLCSCCCCCCCCSVVIVIVSPFLSSFKFVANSLIFLYFYRAFFSFGVWDVRTFVFKSQPVFTWRMKGGGSDWYRYLLVACVVCCYPCPLIALFCVYIIALWSSLQPSVCLSTCWLFLLSLALSLRAHCVLYAGSFITPVSCACVALATEPLASNKKFVEAAKSGEVMMLSIFRLWAHPECVGCVGLLLLVLLPMLLIMFVGFCHIHTCLNKPSYRWHFGLASCRTQQPQKSAFMKSDDEQEDTTLRQLLDSAKLHLPYLHTDPDFDALVDKVHVETRPPHAYQHPRSKHYGDEL